MVANKYEALEFILENDVKFIRLQFCDLFGTLKNISIMPSQIEKAFEEGIAFDASAVKGFLSENEGELFLVPDPTTMCVLPWRPQQGRVVRFFCDIRREDGTAFESDGRNILKRTVEASKGTGYNVTFGTECKFYLFETDELGKPVLKPHDRAGFFDVAPLDKGENIRREICLTLGEMGLEVESSHHDSGNGQHEIVFKYANALDAADNFVTFKTVVKAIASINGLYASFLPKPMNGMNGSALQVDITLSKDGINLFDSGVTEETGAFAAGILQHIGGISAFSNPLVNSYKRFGEEERRAAWTYQNKPQLVRIIKDRGQSSRLQLNSPDPAASPYLLFALLTSAGFDGLSKGLQLPPEHTPVKDAALPADLKTALRFAGDDALIRSTIGEETIQKYLKAKHAEWESYASFVDTWEINTYLGTV